MRPRTPRSPRVTLVRPAVRVHAPSAAIAVLVAAASCHSDTSSPAPPPPPGISLSVMPPGDNGNAAGGAAGPSGQPAASFPPHFDDQLALYGDLSYAQPHLRDTPCKPPVDATAHQATSDLVCNYYKSAALAPDTVTSTTTVTAPSGGQVTIRRDGWGVPFVSAHSRADAMFGFGYASAQDRLWLYDLLRNLGRGQLSAFLGPAPSFYAVDSGYANVSGYDDSELAQMLDDTQAEFGSLGQLFIQDVDADLAGINAYIDSLSGSNAGQVPPEYTSLKAGQGFPPAHFTRNDILASSVFIQSTFGVGGGAETSNELLLQSLDPSFGAGSTTVGAPACLLWRDLRHADDPDATRTIDQPFSESPAKLDETCPQSLPPGAAIWDVGSLQTFAPFGAAASTSMSLVRSSPRVGVDPIRDVRAALRAAGLALPDHLSNFMAVNAALTRDKRPIAVMGPQTSYFVPQLLWEVALHSDGGTPLDFDARGVVFANLPYISIGRTGTFAWSATSGDSDMVDVRVSAMCNADGSPPSRADANGDGFPDATGYLFDAGDGQGPQCRRFFERTDQWTAPPTLASLAAGGQLAAQIVTRHVMRTHYGPVFATATVQGSPVALSLQRSTFHAEAHSAVPFALVSAGAIHDAKTFQRVFNGNTGTFNWLYVDDKDVGYFHSGLYPLRDPGQSPDLPVWGDGRFEWASGRGLPADFFASHGGTVPYPAQVAPSFQGDPMQGFVDWPSFMPFAQ
ncbi:MAG TPA: penicillin acylase family protein, partial [Polyangiaceae bacterium]|nr:penicillin acylase family protein [Polyangiaceae bacterium]